MNVLRIIIFFGAILLAGLGNVFGQTFDISSGGLPTITGASGGSVTGSSSTVTNLTVTINWGEISPSNTNNVVKVNVPIAIRSISPYQVTAVVTGGTNANAQALQRSDIGFGLVHGFNNMGANSQGGCANPDVYNPAITEDPTVGITMNAAGRATYISSVNNLATSTRILNGPRLSVVAAGAGRRTDNGWILNIIFCVTPQFYATGITTSTITFTISAGPNLAC